MSRPQAKQAVVAQREKYCIRSAAWYKRGADEDKKRREHDGQDDDGLGGVFVVCHGKRAKDTRVNLDGASGRGRPHDARVRRVGILVVVLQPHDRILDGGGGGGGATSTHACPPPPPAPAPPAPSRGERGARGVVDIFVCGGGGGGGGGRRRH